MIEWIVSSSVLICAVFVLRGLLKEKMSVRTLYWLWCVVMIRLLVPFSIADSAYSVMNVVQKFDVVQTLEQLEGIGEIEHTAQGSVEGYYADHLMPDTPTVIVQNADEQEFSRMKLLIEISQALDLMWKSGMIICASVLLLTNLDFRRRLTQSRRELRDLHLELPVYHSDLIEVPCLFGLLRPAIYVTGEVVENPAMMKHILAHELTHYRHKDHIWSALWCGALALHWYNPLVWAAIKMARWDRELACDEGTLEELGETERAPYGRTLIRLSQKDGYKGAGLVAATCISGDAGRLRERVLRIAKGEKAGLITSGVTILLVAVILVCTLFGAEKVEPEQDGPLLVGETAVEQGDQIPIFLDLSGDFPHAAKEYAMEHIAKAAANCNRSWEGNGFELRAVEGTGRLDRVETGTEAENFKIEMYALDFEVRLEGDAEQYLGGGMRYEKIDDHYWLMGYSNTEITYLLLACEETPQQEVWTRIGMINEEDLEFYYGTPEMLVRYGSKYTAAAVEIYYRTNGISYADVDHDGIRERLQAVDTGDGMMFQLRAEADDGSLLWQEQAHTAHIGWNSLFLCQMDGEDYLLRYRPVMSTGMAAYEYTLFTLENGSETVVKENSISFFVADTVEITPEMETFAQEINQLLSHSVVLLSTEDGKAVIGPASAYPYMERYDFLDEKISYPPK